MPLLILFILVPIIEITLFIQVGEQIGLGWTIATVIITALIGTHLVRSQGLKALASAQTAVEQNKLPLEEVFTGLCLLVAGALLLTPGFLTDAIGFILLAPPFRKFAGTRVLAYLKSRGSVHFHSQQGFNAQGGRYREDIIEGEFEIVDEDSGSAHRTGGGPNGKCGPRIIDVNSTGETKH